MKVHEQEMSYSSLPSQLNTLTDAVCIMMLMEDSAVSVAALSIYILHNTKHQIDALLEIDRKEMLDFGVATANTPKYSLRQFIGNNTFKDLVLKIV